MVLKDLSAETGIAVLGPGYVGLPLAHGFSQIYATVGYDINRQPEAGSYDAIIIAVPHRQFQTMGIQAIKRLGKPNSVVFEVKSTFTSDAVDGSL